MEGKRVVLESDVMEEDAREGVRSKFGDNFLVEAHRKDRQTGWTLFR